MTISLLILAPLELVHAAGDAPITQIVNRDRRGRTCRQVTPTWARLRVSTCEAGAYTACPVSRDAVHLGA